LVPRAVAAELHLPDYSCSAVSVFPVILTGIQVDL